MHAQRRYRSLCVIAFWSDTRNAFLVRPEHKCGEHCACVLMQFYKTSVTLQQFADVEDDACKCLHKLLLRAFQDMDVISYHVISRHSLPSVEDVQIL